MVEILMMKPNIIFGIFKDDENQKWTVMGTYKFAIGLFEKLKANAKVIILII